MTWWQNVSAKHTFNSANDGHNEVRVWVQLSCMSDAIVDLFTTNDLLHNGDNNFDWQEFAYFVDNVKGWVENQVPEINILKLH